MCFFLVKVGIVFVCAFLIIILMKESSDTPLGTDIDSENICILRSTVE